MSHPHAGWCSYHLIPVSTRRCIGCLNIGYWRRRAGSHFRKRYATNPTQTNAPAIHLGCYAFPQPLPEPTITFGSSKIPSSDGDSASVSDNSYLDRLRNASECSLSQSTPNRNQNKVICQKILSFLISHFTDRKQHEIHETRKESPRQKGKRKKDKGDKKDKGPSTFNGISESHWSSTNTVISHCQKRIQGRANICNLQSAICNLQSSSPRRPQSELDQQRSSNFSLTTDNSSSPSMTGTGSW